MVGFVVDDAYGLSVVIIIALLILIAMILIYRGFRGEPKTHRTRLGVFVERDRFEEIMEVDEDPLLKTQRDWPPESSK